MPATLKALLLLAALSPASVAAADSPWHAQWIVAADAAAGPNTWQAFRSEIFLETVPGNVTARIAASDKYWLWVNGERVVFEGQLKRGPTPDDTYYDTVDLTPYLLRGTNTIAVAVWYWGRSGYSHQSSGQAGLLFEADFGGQLVTSDARWRAVMLPAYGSTGGPLPATALAARSIRYDARLAIEGWQQPGFDDDAWPAPRELGAPPVAPWNELVARPIPMWRDHGLRDYAEVPNLPAVNSGGVVIARLPYDAQVTPYLKVDAPAGKVIRMRTDTWITSRINTLEAEYVTRAGVQEYESYGWLSGHEVQYEIPPGVRVLELKYRETGYDADFEGVFRSDDDMLNTLWTKARRTLYVNMRDNHMDCPDRERAQWHGDMVVQMGQVFYALDAAAGPLLARKGWRQMAAWQRADDALVTPSPFGQGMNSPEIPLQMLASVGWYGLWSYYVYTGDAETIAATYPAVRDYLALWSLQPDGLVRHREGDWAWPDWGQNADYPVLENAWYYLALKGAAEMATLIGAGTDAARYRARMDSVRTAFYPAFWQNGFFRSAGHAGAVDDRSNALAVLAGLVRPEDHAAILAVLESQHHASPYMEKYVLEAMFVLGGATEAMERMRRRYRPQIESWISTLWEDWEWQEWNGYNHAWAGGPLTLLSQYAVGVAPAEPGYASYSLLPMMGSLRAVDAVVPTPRGAIRVNLERDSATYRVTVDAPGAPGRVSMPVHELEELIVNDAVIWRDGLAVPNQSGVTLDSLDLQRAHLTVPAGRWIIESIGAATLLDDETDPELDSGEVFNLSENPVRSGSVTFNFRETPASAGMFTLDGRRVADLTRRMSNEKQAIWDLRNDEGTRVTPGVYLLVARVGNEVIRRRLIVF